MYGTVRSFNATKGYGFIRPNWNQGNPAADVFVHRSAIERLPAELRAQLLEGELVEFEVSQDRRGRRCAVNVRRRPPAPSARAPGGPGAENQQRVMLTRQAALERSASEGGRDR